MFVVVEVEVDGMMGTGIMEHTLAVIEGDRRGISETSAPRDQGSENMPRNSKDIDGSH